MKIDTPTWVTAHLLQVMTLVFFSPLLLRVQVQFDRLLVGVPT